MWLRRISPPTELVRQRTAGTRGFSQPVPLPRLWSVIVGAFLIISAFPRLAQARENFYLRVRGPSMARPGDLIVYAVEYENLGWPFLTDVTLVSRIPKHTSFVSASPSCKLYGNTLACRVGGLLEGEGGQVEVTLRVDESAPAGASIRFKVVAMTQELGQKELLDRAWAYTKIVIPRLAVTKRSSADMVYEGEPVTYTYVVANTGCVVLKDVTLVDDKKRPTRVCNSVARLRPGESFTCTWMTTLDADTTNVATATGLDPWGNLVRDTARACVHVAAPDAALALSLTASASRVYAGEVVTYTYVVSNVGSDVAYDVVLSDDVVGKIAGPFNLIGGKSATLVASGVLSEDTANVAMTTGQNRQGRSLSATDTVLVDTIQRPDPDGGGILALTVTPSATSVEAGTVVTYTYAVTNVSQDMVCQVVVHDDQFSYIIDFHPLLGEFGTQDVPYSFCLQGGESRMATFLVPLYQTIRNTAVATGLDLLMTEVSAEATAFVDVSKEHDMFLPIVFKNSP
jgi:uncharacterized repeat protein (TIGR01451 family)